MQSLVLLKLDLVVGQDLLRDDEPVIEQLHGRFRTLGLEVGLAHVFDRFFAQHLLEGLDPHRFALRIREVKAGGCVVKRHDAGLL